MILAVYKLCQVDPDSGVVQVLTDTVEDNDGCVDGVTHNSQHAGNEMYYLRIALAIA